MTRRSKSRRQNNFRQKKTPFPTICLTRRVFGPRRQNRRGADDSGSFSFYVRSLRPVLSLFRRLFLSCFFWRAHHRADASGTPLCTSFEFRERVSPIPPNGTATTRRGVFFCGGFVRQFVSGPSQRWTCQQCLFKT